MREREGYGGYITVEASFVFPIVIFIILILLKFSFTIYNRSAQEINNIFLNVRAECVQKHYYNTETEGMDIKRAVNVGLINMDAAEYKASDIKNSTVVRIIHVVKNHVGRMEDDD